MNDDTTFWITVWKLVAICFIILVMSITTYSVIANQQFASMIARGADPIKVRCAMGSDSNCMIYLKGN